MKKVLMPLLFMSLILSLGSFKNHNIHKQSEFNLEKGSVNLDNVSDYGFYVGYFWAEDPEFPMLSIGKVNVYAQEIRTSDSPILTGKLLGVADTIAFTASGDYEYIDPHTGNVIGFDGNVNYAGRQIHITYTGNITYP